jgi:glucose/arabinose dehydrogenase
MTRRQMTLVAGFLTFTAFVLTGCPRANGYMAEQVIPRADFAQMLAMEPIPGDASHALVASQDGVIRRVSMTSGTEPATVFLDLRTRMIPAPMPEEGLLGLVLAPDYASSGRFYVHYTAAADLGLITRKGVLSRFVAHGASANVGSEQVILEVPQPRINHNGGPLAFGPDGFLYMALGDGGGVGDPDGNGQNLHTLLGKILRLDVSGAGDGYKIPADNPFVGKDARPEIFAYGLRNPWRFSFDTKTGQLWAGDVGQNRWEEVERILPGQNYGWNTMEGKHCYKPEANCDGRGLTLPRAEYAHEFGCAVTGGYVYRGSAMPELDGWYVYGDFCTGRVWGVDIGNDAGAAIPLADTEALITSFAQDADGEVYIVTFNHAIFKLVRKPA